VADNASSRAGPRYSGYDWDKFPEYTDLAEALASHRSKQQTAEGTSVNSYAVILHEAEPTKRRQQLIKLFNNSAEKNRTSTEVGWRKPGTLDVLDLAQHGLETVSAYHQQLALKDTIKALPHVEHDNQQHAREFARAFVPLLSNWLKKPTGRTDFRNEDIVKGKRLLDFFMEVNELDGSRDESSLDAEQLRNVRGIQHAVYTALLPQTFKVFDEAMPPDWVQSLTDEIKEIGDKLLQSQTFANNPALREKIQETCDQAKKHYEAAGKRREELGKKKTGSQEKAATEHVALPIASGKPAKALPLPAPAGLKVSAASPAGGANARDNNGISTERPQRPPSRARGAISESIQPTAPPLGPKVPSETEQALPIRTRTRRKYLGWLPGKLGASYTPAFSLPAPSQPPQQDGPQLSAPPGFSDFVVDRSANQPVLKNIRVKAQPSHGRGRAFTLTDSNKMKMDLHADGALRNVLLARSASPSQYWNFSEDSKNGWEAHPSAFVRQSAKSKMLQKILHGASSGNKDKAKGIASKSRN
jgi:hypothetical protein